MLFVSFFASRCLFFSCFKDISIESALKPLLALPFASDKHMYSRYPVAFHLILQWGSQHESAD